MYNILIFGTGNGNVNMKKALNFNKVDILAFVDNNVVKHGKDYENKKIISPKKIINYEYDYIIIASQFYEEIFEQLMVLGIKKEKIIKFYEHPIDFISYKYDLFLKISTFMEEEFLDIYEKCYEYTMTSVKKMYSLYKATKYIVSNNIEGDIVECGVWKGGSSMISALTMINMSDVERKIYLYDTYEGMSEPTEKDKILWNEKSAKQEKIDRKFNSYKEWCYSSLKETRNNLFTTQYPENKLCFVKGKVEDTIPHVIPNKISILRLDTDWYESTYHELKYLYPKLSQNGVIIFDDYGYWKGQKDAVDQYLKENNINILLNDIDGSGMIGIKI